MSLARWDADAARWVPVSGAGAGFYARWGPPPRQVINILAKHYASGYVASMINVPVRLAQYCDAPPAEMNLHPSRQETWASSSGFMGRGLGVTLRGLAQVGPPAGLNRESGRYGR
jgi:hypothetical protein